MATITDLVHDVINYLVTTAGANTALAAIDSPRGTIVMDAHVVGETPTEYNSRLWIGYDPTTDAPEAATAVQKFAFLGASGNVRDEEGAITCTAEYWSGDTTAANNRAQCKAIVGAVETMLRGAPTTGPGDSSMGGLVQWSETRNFKWKQRQYGGGESEVCIFDVVYFARLTP